MMWTNDEFSVTVICWLSILCFVFLFRWYKDYLWQMLIGQFFYAVVLIRAIWFYRSYLRAKRLTVRSELSKPQLMEVAEVADLIVVNSDYKDDLA